MQAVLRVTAHVKRKANPQLHSQVEHLHDAASAPAASIRHSLQHFALRYGEGNIKALPVHATKAYTASIDIALRQVRPVAQSVLRLATGWTVKGSNPGGGKIFCTRPDQPWGAPSFLYNGYRVSFPGVKRPGRCVDHPPPSSAEVKERVELYLYIPSGP